MAATKQEREALLQDSEDGDTTADLALRDIDQEDGVPTPGPLEPGEWLMVYTATAYVVGRFAGDDHEWLYFLGPQVAHVFETGPLEDFYSTGQAQSVEYIPVRRGKLFRVRKGPTIMIAAWPFDRLPTQAERRS